MRALSKLLILSLALSLALGPNVAAAADDNEIGCHCVTGHGQSAQDGQDATANAAKRPRCHGLPAADLGADAEPQKDRCKCRSRASIAGNTCSCRHHGAEGITLPDRTLIPPTVMLARLTVSWVRLRSPRRPQSVASVPEIPPPTPRCIPS